MPTTKSTERPALRVPQVRVLKLLAKDKQGRASRKTIAEKAKIYTGHVFIHVGQAEQDFVDRRLQRRLIDARPHGRIALRIEIDQQYALRMLSQPRRQIDCRRGLAYSAFLVGDTEYFGHEVSRVRKNGCAIFLKF